MKYLIIIISIFIFSCNNNSITNPNIKKEDTVQVSKIGFLTTPSTWIEVEDILLQDTTWWTFTSNKKVYAAWKRKVTNNWIYYGVKINGDSVNNMIMTRTEYANYIKNAWLPIQYYAGTFYIKNDILVFILQRVIPGSYYNVRCDIVNNSPITQNQLYYNKIYTSNEYEILGLEVDEYGNEIKYSNTNIGDAEIILKRWNGYHLIDKINPIYKEL